ncbi:MAG: flp pilus-assembly TadE/G-like family protein [Geodermatophilaceae bacterium]|nr:flp pilus-assembly TadE/G-like family protein [Geodermatophilaceae bacterium]
MFGLYLGSAVLARHRAESAADLAALAAAGAAPQGADSACGQAERVAAGMNARLDSCRLVGLVAEIQVSVTTELAVVGEATAHGRARAGPVSATPP